MLTLATSLLHHVHDAAGRPESLDEARAQHTVNLRSLFAGPEPCKDYDSWQKGTAA